MKCFEWSSVPETKFMKFDVRKKKKKKELRQASSYPSISGPEILPPLLQDAWYSIVFILAGTNNVMRYVQDYGKIT